MVRGRSRKPKKPFGNLLMISWPVDVKEGNPRRARFNFDLSLQEFGVIGLIVVHWAFLESALFERTVQLVYRYRIPLPNEAVSLSFTRRLRVFRDVVEQNIKRKPTKAKLLNLVSRIARAEGYRHRIAHGLWSYNPRRLEQLWAIDRRQGHVEPFDVKKLRDFSNSLGELSFELLHPAGWRPSLFIRKDKKTGHWIGGGTPREALLRFREKNPMISEEIEKAAKRMDELAR
jgi:hypothetical protein